MQSNKEKAILHTQYMQLYYGYDIRKSFCLTRQYNDADFQDRPEQKTAEDTKVVLINTDSVSAVFNQHFGKTCVLNFASFKAPGGMFLEGSSAQEESLCHESNLYNVLKQFPEFYENNKHHLNNHLYENHGLYTPDIVFERGNETVRCDVITLAAPNKRAAATYRHISSDANTKALISRIRFMYNMAADNNVQTLILGAYGCGVFGQDPEEVATIMFHELHNTYSGCFQNVVFALTSLKNKETFSKAYLTESNYKSNT